MTPHLKKLKRFLKTQEKITITHRERSIFHIGPVITTTGTVSSINVSMGIGDDYVLINTTGSGNEPDVEVYLAQIIGVFAGGGADAAIMDFKIEEVSKQ